MRTWVWFLASILGSSEPSINSSHLRASSGLWWAHVLTWCPHHWKLYLKKRNTLYLTKDNNLLSFKLLKHGYTISNTSLYYEQMFERLKGKEGRKEFGCHSLSGNRGLERTLFTLRHNCIVNSSFSHIGKILEGRFTTKAVLCIYARQEQHRIGLYVLNAKTEIGSFK